LRTKRNKKGEPAIEREILKRPIQQLWSPPKIKRKKKRPKKTWFPVFGWKKCGAKKKNPGDKGTREKKTKIQNMDRKGPK